MQTQSDARTEAHCQEPIMTIVLNHTIVPARDKVAAARFFAELFGLPQEPVDYFAPVRVNGETTLLFSDEDSAFESHHYAFHVSDAEFDAIFGRIKAAGLAYGSDPSHLENGKLNNWGGGRGVYFRDPDGHVLELMTVPQ
jgi:catechol 2,3-dioxygenase-like lactoylglutathione lyase family enzyme